MCSNEGDIVFDPFVGIGTTARVAKKMNRKYIGVDINENYINEAKTKLLT